MGVVGRRRQRHVARGETAAGGDQGLAGAKVHARLAQIVASERGGRERDAVALAPDILLNDDGVGAFGHRRAGEDAHRFARTEGARRKRRPAADSPITVKVAGAFSRVGGAHRIAVHGGVGERRLGPAAP